MNDDMKQLLATAVKWGVGLLAAAIVAYAVFLAVGDIPSCEERGGRIVLSHMLPIVTGKTLIVVPVYLCEEVAP